MRKVRYSLSGLILVFVLIFSSLSVFASDDEGEWSYTNDDTGYSAVFIDAAGVIDKSDESDLKDSLKGLTAYGNAMCLTAVAGGYADDDASRAVAKNFYESVFGMDTGLVAAVVLDSDLEGGCTLWIESYEPGSVVYKTISVSIANTITDNAVNDTKRAISKEGHPTRWKFYGYLNVALTQCLNALDGLKIAQPMKFITSALLALILALLVNFIIVRMTNSPKKAADAEVLRSIQAEMSVRDPRMILTSTTKTYSPRSSSGGGGGGGGGGGSHGGGHRG
ncbi:MAG: hypothetical protein K5686_06545 [Lachnospiraceae bacterium]|nr:hypothetical protein [Lachnospiraceae bacterium]